VQALVIAAGQGTRLRAHGPSKPLVQLLGRPLIAHVLERLKQGGITECVVVTGYLSDVLEVALAQISEALSLPIATVCNTDWHLANGVSVLAARDKLHEQFILTMCDHVVEPELVSRMVQTATVSNPALGVDFNLGNPDVDLEDVTRVQAADGVIQTIGKLIPRYNGYDCGVFSASTKFLEALDVCRQNKPSFSISDGVAALAEPLRAIDVTGLRWIDVDDPAMFARAETWLAKG
jgi:1L-myo-inositol 1-phosphate cytidylyltransferase